MVPGSEGRDGIVAQADAPERSLTYCVIPRELADQLHEPLRRHFRDDPTIEVIVERREADRRSGEDRRRKPVKERKAERRRVRAATGRRVADRRALQAEVEPLPLPRRARRFAERIAFLRRREPPTQKREDRDTARLVARFQAGERDTFGTLYARYYDRIYGYMLVVLSRSHDAEDATQEVFANALAALPRYERREQPFRAWLFRIARNVAVDQLRLNERIQPVEPEEVERRRDETEQADEPEIADLPILDWISDRDLALFVRRLTAPQRQVLMLRFTADLDDGAIAAVMDRTPEDVRQLRSRALSFLRERLAAVGNREPTEAPSNKGSKMKRAPKEAPVIRNRRWALYL